MKLNNNFKDQIIRKIAYKSSSMGCSGKLIKIMQIIKKEDPERFKKLHSEINSRRITMREYYEKEEYPDISKVRIKSLRKLICLLIILRSHLKEEYPDNSGDILIYRIRDLNVNDVPEEILEILDISKRTLYDYLKTLQMILDYSTF